ncbi:hypothetical protein [Halovenus marina]|uniref:hypothetical protein n=1 Tax=Halovenus marina TaxID=3396621 RepID=UPI003F57A493
MVAGKRSVDGVGIDASYQHISEAPAYNDPDGETVDVVTDDDVGEETTEGVPDLNRRPEGDGQTTLDDWGWSA